ncbi:polyprenyl synthetase family protein [Massilia sp. W12]|uniref:polyprenyl synthetase family protein n=1 Tax=Massilia sp. W12 TaxID=3126507 RepID=UPI0030D4E723
MNAHWPNADFSAWSRAIAEQVENGLHTFLPPEQEHPARLHQAMRYAVLDGGKRVRPLLAYAAGELFDAGPDATLRAACAVEMIHAYSLVHDDMPCMDDDALRRGKPTVHKAYDEATALLVGDALQAQAFAVLSEGELAQQAPARALHSMRLLAAAAGSRGMCGGQAIDLESVGKRLNRPELETMHRLKTGAMLEVSILLGAWAGRQPQAQELAALKDYAQAIGLAFQVVDDVLDATEDSAQLGKTAGKDAADNKPTYVTILGLDASRALAQELQQSAHDALLPFGEKAQRLHQLADLIVQRKA